MTTSSESRRSCPRRADASGYTLVEIVVAAAIFSIAVAYALGSFYYGRRAADRADKVDDYREMRVVFNRIARDLQDATRVKLPAYDTHSLRLVLLDSRDREVVYSMRDASGAEVAAEPPVDAPELRVVRTADEKSEPLRQTGRILWMKFTRLGERLIGLTVRMRPREQGKPGATYTATMSLNRIVL